MKYDQFGPSVGSHTLAMRPSNTLARRKINALVFLTENVGPDILPHLLQNPDLNLRIVSESSREEFAKYVDDGVLLDGLSWYQNCPEDTYRNHSRLLGHQLARWADLLFIVMDSSMMSLMMAGYTTDVILHVLRCWDTSKRIIALPELSVDQWKHPIWKKQVSKLENRWEWVNVLPPALWDFPDTDFVRGAAETPDLEVDRIWLWDGPSEIIEAIHSETQSILRRPNQQTYSRSDHDRTGTSVSRSKLPMEVWTAIFDHLGDWELATALGIYTHLPVPYEWTSLIPKPGKSRTIEYTILTQPLPNIRAFFTNAASAQRPTILLPMASKLIFKFSMTNVLNYLALQQKDIFWTSFGLALLPHKASLIYNSPKILQWWLTCPAIIKKEYGPEALDGASRAGFVEVLDWWLRSELKLWYTEKALESASAKGHIEVLDWWKSATESRRGTGIEKEVPLKVGKSILTAAQAGRADSIAWWEASGIPYGHEADVARLASTHGHVSVLELWYSLKGSKMIFDNQVLIGPTKNGHAAVLQWWKDVVRKSEGIVVEYKTCDIEEAMEDAVGGGGEGEVREWWSRNGLNLGVGTGEWMRVKTL